MGVIQKGHHKLLHNRLFQIGWIEFMILHLISRISHEDGRWMNEIYFLPSEIYIHVILDLQ